MTLRPYKFIVQAVVQDVDDEGRVIGEPVTEPVTVYGCEALAEWANTFTDVLATQTT